MRIGTIVSVLLLAVYATCTLQDLITAMTPTATSPGCISFSPFVGSYTPHWGPFPPEDLITTLLNTLVTQTGYRCIHIYDLGGSYETVVRVAHSLNIKVLANVYIDSAALTISNIDSAITVANAYPNTLLGISCGSETIYESNNPGAAYVVVRDCVTKMRNGGVKQPIGYIDVFTGWCGAEATCTNFFRDLQNIVDFVGLDDVSLFT